MDSKIVIVVLVVILIVIEVLIFFSLHRSDVRHSEEERETHERQLLTAIAVTIFGGFFIAILLLDNGSSDSHEYGFLKKAKKALGIPAKKKIAPPVPAVHTAGRKIYGNPMKQPDYRPSGKYVEPIDASKIYGGAAAAADINRNPLYKKK